MKKMMSMIREKKARLATAVLAATMAMSMAAPMVASAHTVYDESAGNLMEIVGEKTPGYVETRIPHSNGPQAVTAESVPHDNLAAFGGRIKKDQIPWWLLIPQKKKEERSEYYYKRQNEYTRLCQTRKMVTITNNGAYHAKDICLYGRRILGVYPDGEYLLDEWEVIGKGKCLHGLGTQSTTYDIEGTYAVLAFSFDITAGTDYPYSGVFWNNEDDTSWEKIDINLDGSCRMADINIKVGNKTVVDEENCSSHKEWTP